MHISRIVYLVAMGNEFEWDIQERGKVLSGFFYGYILSQIFGAVLSKQIGGDVVLGIAAFSFSLTTMLVPFCAKLGTTALLANRLLVGLFEGVTFPVIYHIFALNVFLF